MKIEELGAIRLLFMLTQTARKPDNRKSRQPDRDKKIEQL